MHPTVWVWCVHYDCIQVFDVTNFSDTQRNEHLDKQHMLGVTPRHDKEVLHTSSPRHDTEDLQHFLTFHRSRLCLSPCRFSLSRGPSFDKIKKKCIGNRSHNPVRYGVICWTPQRTAGVVTIPLANSTDTKVEFSDTRWHVQSSGSHPTHTCWSKMSRKPTHPDTASCPPPCTAFVSERKDCTE